MGRSLSGITQYFAYHFRERDSPIKDRDFIHHPRARVINLKYATDII
jgi:hypothetical protein